MKKKLDILHEENEVQFALFMVYPNPKGEPSHYLFTQGEEIGKLVEENKLFTKGFLQLKPQWKDHPKFTQEPIVKKKKGNEKSNENEPPTPKSSTSAADVLNVPPTPKVSTSAADVPYVPPTPKVSTSAADVPYVTPTPKVSTSAADVPYVTPTTKSSTSAADFPEADKEITETDAIVVGQVPDPEMSPGSSLLPRGIGQPDDDDKALFQVTKCLSL